MDDINKEASKQLNILAKKYNLNSTTTSTIYHFGFSPTSNQFEGYAYRSLNNFAQEKLNYGLGIKPDDNEALRYINDVISVQGFPDLAQLIELMNIQKTADNKKRVSERVGIGGSLHFCYLNQNRQSIWDCYTFEDYGVLYQKMIENLNRR